MCAKGMIIKIDAVRNKDVLKIIILISTIVTIANGIRTLPFNQYYDNEWLGSHFPIVVDPFLLPLSEQCVNDTVMQLAALRNGLPWAIESKLRFFFNVQ